VGQAPESSITWWLLAIGLATLIRVVLFVAYYCTEPEKRYIKDWQVSYAISLLINGVVWGLGLSIAQSLARAMGGDILLASQLDKGQPLVPVVLPTADNRTETKKRA